MIDCIGSVSRPVVVIKIVSIVNYGRIAVITIAVVVMCMATPVKAYCHN
jgi:hypothetical protein